MNTEAENRIWYVYEHFKADTNEIFYVGIGKQPNLKRAYTKDSRKPHWHNIVNKHGIDVKLIATSLSKDQAIEMEIMLIKKYGRINLGTGKLINLTDGGEGVVNYRHTEEWKRQSSERGKKLRHSEATKKRMSEYHKNRPKEHLANLSKSITGRKHSEETKRKISNILFNRSPDIYAKIAAANRRRKGKMSEKTRKLISENSKKMWRMIREKKNGEASKNKLPLLF